jgi:tRNA-splicing ligase RtcB
MGSRVGDYFNNIASKMNKKWYSSCGHIPFLPVDTSEGNAYLAWQEFCLQFAYLNRRVMLEEVKDALWQEFPTIKWTTKELFEDSKNDILNKHHNYCILESHLGKNGYIHRKGSTAAFEGDTCIIPGSMDTASYIAVGKGHKLSLQSCSHGSGRAMSRTAFNVKMKHSYAQIEKRLEGITHSEFKEVDRGKAKGFLDVSETGGAYKDISWVMSQQIDLVKPLVKLKPLICLKG